MDDITIRTAVAAWLGRDEADAEATYGHISTWETGGVTDMSNLFCGSAALTEQGCTRLLRPLTRTSARGIPLA